MIVKWLKGSGLVVNNNKTEVCLFHRNDQLAVMVNVCGTPVMTKKSMNVLGFIFGSNFNQKEHVANAIKTQTKHFMQSEL